MISATRARPVGLYLAFVDLAGPLAARAAGLGAGLGCTFARAGGRVILYPCLAQRGCRGPVPRGMGACPPGKSKANHKGHQGSTKETTACVHLVKLRTVNCKLGT